MPKCTKCGQGNSDNTVAYLFLEPYCVDCLAKLYKRKLKETRELQAEIALLKKQVGFIPAFIISTFREELDSAKAEIQRLKEKVDLQADAGNWANRVFGKHQTVTGVMNHFKKECLEFVETDTPNEAADCLLLLMQHAHEKGYDLLEEGRKKHNINLKRKWAEPDSFGVIEHIKESGDKK